MPSARYGLNCALMKNTTNGGAEIVAAGGHHAGTYLKTVEIFNFETLSWRTAGQFIIKDIYVSFLAIGDSIAVRPKA